jgi:4-methyl-5(b-hydroxyethyl)-thiazole monophosphate biosynthesis
MSKKILEIIADGFEEVEALAPCDFWRRCGFTVDLAALTGDSAVGAHNITVKCDTGVAQINVSDYDMVFLPGGMPGSLNLYNSQQVEKILQAMSTLDRYTAAVCAAPMVLHKAGLLRGKKCTMYPSTELRQKYCSGINFIEMPAVADGKVITGRGPGAAFALAYLAAKLLGEAETAAKVAKEMLIPEASL